MKFFLKRIIPLLLVITTVFPICCYAHDEEGHNGDLELVLFPIDYFLSSQSTTAQNAVKALEAASYLTLDQFNEYGQAKLDILHELGVLGIPNDLSAIDFKWNSQHRNFTHRGWDYTYTDDKAHWETRKKILIETINSQFDFGTSNAISGYNKQCTSFAAIVYYIHVIGDHNEDSSYKVSELKMALGGRKDENDIIHELLKHSDILFSSQHLSINYLLYTSKLSSLNRKMGKIINSEGGINSQEKFDKYHEYGEQLLEVLQKYLPELLKEEDFFSSVFYPNEAQ